MYCGEQWKQQNFLIVRVVKRRQREMKQEEKAVSLGQKTNKVEDIVCTLQEKHRTTTLQFSIIYGQKLLALEHTG